MRIPAQRRSGAATTASSSLGRWCASPFHSFTSALALVALASIPAAPANAFNFTPVNSSSIALGGLGSIGIAGNFTGVSLFEFEEQIRKADATQGSTGLMARLPNGAFATVLSADASIMAMCSFLLENGTNAGVVLGGNFTSIGSQQAATAIALFNPNATTATPLPGLSGQVNAVLCDQERSSIYVGGNFIGPNSTNAIAWDAATSAWSPLPFAGFNGPVTSIAQASNGHIIFGGSFTSLGNATTVTQQEGDGQVINLSSANISATGSSSTDGLADPNNIVCKTSGADGAGNTWLLADNTPGSWNAEFSFGFQPTKLRLWNTRLDGRGTQTWRFTALPLNGIMNFTYVDPDTGANATCTSECPLGQTGTYQDFTFVNQVGMNAFRIDVSAWFGAGGGLDGIELFQNDIFAYAINGFNEPSCAVSASEISQATSTGPWTVSPSFQSSSEYLTAELTAPISSSSASVVFSPDIRQSGNYTVHLYTPGCMQDNTCSTRGQVNITVSMAEDQAPTSVTLFQTNNFDKYDQVYSGSIDAPTGSFRPTVTLTPLDNQSLDTMTIVAQRVGFTLINSTGGLNGLFEYDPASSTVSSDLSTSAFDKLGASFSTASVVNALVTSGDDTYIAGNFTSTAASNIVSVNSKESSVQALSASLKGTVSSMIMNGADLFVGGIFTSLVSDSVAGLSNVARYDTVKDAWNPLGAGVDGPVIKVVLMTMNLTGTNATGTTPEVVVALTGGFRQLLGFGTNAAVPVDGFGVWVPSKNNWLQNLGSTVPSVEGVLLSSLLDVPGADALYGGSLSFAQIGANGAATLSGSGIGSFGVDILASATTTSTATAAVVASKRDTSTDSSIAGVLTGLFDTANGRNKTVLAGHFSANVSAGTLVQNLVVIDNKNNGTVTGLGPGISDTSAFVALAMTGDTLFAGGNVTGTVNSTNVKGLISYNMATNTFNTQPPALSGGNNSVTAIQVRPDTSDVYVGGTFEKAGSLGCPGVCYYSTSAGQWNRPGLNLGASTVNTMAWTTSTTLIAGGSLAVNSTATTFLAEYDANRQVWDAFAGSTDALPGPVSLLALGAGDGSEIWVAGTANSNGTIFLMKYDGHAWTDALGASGQTLSPGTDLRSLQVFPVSLKHDTTSLLAGDQILMLTGSIVLPDSRVASAVVFDGKTFAPYALTTNAGGSTGSIASIFAEKNTFSVASKRGHLPLVAIVLIGLGISLVLMLAIVAAGLLLDRIRKKRQGYVPAPSTYGGMSHLPPQELFESLGRTRPEAPRV